jgi:phenylacetic acid degradation operon negative regulatory protein
VQLSWAGFGSLGPGIWISPWPEREAEALDVIGSLGASLSTRSFVARHGEVGNQTTIVDEAWDLDSLARDYREFMARHELLDPSTPAEAATALLNLVHHWRRFPAVDPALPSELLPTGWPGSQAAVVFDELRRRWLVGADRWWAGQERANGPA